MMIERTLGTDTTWPKPKLVLQKSKLICVPYWNMFHFHGKLLSQSDDESAVE